MKNNIITFSLFSLTFLSLFFFSCETKPIQESTNYVLIDTVYVEKEVIVEVPVKVTEEVIKWKQKFIPIEPVDIVSVDSTLLLEVENLRKHVKALEARNLQEVNYRQARIDQQAGRIEVLENQLDEAVGELLQIPLVEQKVISKRGRDSIVVNITNVPGVGTLVIPINND